MLGGEDDLDDEMYNREGSGAGTDSKRKGCTKARPLLPSAWTQPHVPPLPTHDSPHDSFVDVLRRESAISARAHPLRTACAACASHGAPSCRGTKHRLMAPNTAPSAVEPSIVSRRGFAYNASWTDFADSSPKDRPRDGFTREQFT